MPQSLVCAFGDLSVDTWKHTFWKEDADKVCGDEMDIRGKIVIVTGSNAGVGKETSLQLAKRGAAVIMAVRNLEKGKEALEEIKKRLGKEDASLELMRVDMGDLQSIRDFVKEFQRKYDKLDILVNNAGIADTTGVPKKTKDGHEQHLGTNFYGPFLLTNLLLDSLRKGAPSRVVCVQTTNVVNAKLDLKDLSPDTPINTDHIGFMQYNISKLLSALCIQKLAKSLEGPEQINVYQLCPGIVKTQLSADSSAALSGITKGAVDAIRNTNTITPHQGCETLVYLSVAKSVAEKPDSGRGEMYRFKQLFSLGNKALKQCEEKQMDKVEELYKTAQEIVGLQGK